MRDLEGESLCHANLADDPARIVQFIEDLFRRPWIIAGRWGPLQDAAARREVGKLGSDPADFIAAANLYCFVSSKTSPSMGRTTAPATMRSIHSIPNGVQHFRRRPERYFEPIALTDQHRRPADG